MWYLSNKHVLVCSECCDTVNIINLYFAVWFLYNVFFSHLSSINSAGRKKVGVVSVSTTISSYCKRHEPSLSMTYTWSGGAVQHAFTHTHTQRCALSHAHICQKLKLMSNASRGVRELQNGKNSGVTTDVSHAWVAHSLHISQLRRKIQILIFGCGFEMT